MHASALEFGTISLIELPRVILTCSDSEKVVLGYISKMMAYLVAHNFVVVVFPSFLKSHFKDELNNESSRVDRIRSRKLQNCSRALTYIQFIQFNYDFYKTPLHYIIRESGLA